MAQTAPLFPKCAGVILDDVFEQAQSLAINGNTDAFGLYLDSAESGNPAAAYMVAQYYSKGIKEDNGMDTLFWSTYATLGYYIPGSGMLKTYFSCREIPEGSSFLDYCLKKAEEGSGAAMFVAGMAYYVGAGTHFDPETAFSLFKRSYEAGNADGACQTALCMIRGSGTTQDLEKGLKLLTETAGNGNIRAALKYAWCLEHGIFTQKDRKKAAGIYESLASNKIPIGMYEVGRCYLDGVGFDRDEDMGYSWFTMAESFGSVEGRFGMSRCMLGGIVENKREEGLKLMLECADNGCVDAMIMLAQLYAKGGKMISKNQEKAIEYYQNAADLGNASAELRLYEIYTSGNGVKKNPQKAMRYALRSAAHGNPEACYIAGMATLTGKGAKKDETKGFEMLRISSDAGYMKAAYAVANCYLKGTGVKKDAPKGFEMHRTLAENGFAKSMLYVGESYYLGESVKQDLEEAFRLFSSGAELDNVICQYYLGECYRKGQGVKADEVAALKWYKKAADQGHVISKKIVEDHRNKAILEDQTPFATFEKSARAGNAQSMYIVGRYYEDGIGIEKDLKKAKEWYMKAKKRGNSAARRALEALEVAENREY